MQGEPWSILACCKEIGIPIAPEKTEGPAHVLTFAGIELDCVKHEARLPREKITKCLAIVIEFLSRKKVTLKELQSLIGLLNFACSVIVPGHVFIRRLIYLTIGIKAARHFICLTTEVKKDLRIWENFSGHLILRHFFSKKPGPPRKPFGFTQTPRNPVVLVLFLVHAGHLASGRKAGRKWIFHFSNCIPSC